ncbi:MAG: zinc metalloprotease HtpX [Candidatus Bathyarchaeia archaeon]
MSLWKLRLTMLGTLAIIIGTSTAFFAVLLQYFGSLNIISLAALVALFNIVQWLFAPHLINAIYRVKEVKPTDFPKLQAIIDQLSRKSGIKKPKLGIASIPIPNAFAYGSQLTGNHVAITQGLLDTLEEEEVEAVLGHELGHLKHRDVQIMMLISFLPSLLYLIGRSALYSAYFGGYYGRNKRGGSGLAVLIGMASMAVYFVLLLFVLGLSRLREYYADRHSVSIVEDGPRKLSEGLAKIVSKTGRMRMHHQKEAFTFSSFKTLFISDPDRAERDVAEIAQYTSISSDQGLVERLLKRRVTTADRIMELLSTHPNITKRLKALQALGT